MRQMPSVPHDLIAALPVDFDAVEGKPYVHQTGGWVMAIACADRLFTEVEDGVFLVGTYTEDDPEGKDLYEGTDFQAAWLRLTDG